MTNFPLRPLIAALSLALAGTAHADGPEFKFGGFGTLSAVHSSEKNADFTGSLFHANGAGHSSEWSFSPDSKLGGQINAVFNSKFSAVLQVVAQHQYDGSDKPHVEWANLKYQVTQGLNLRVGRIAMPAFMVSESRLVGYANPWIRPPQEVYGVLPITSNDGLDVTYRNQIAGANNTLQGFYGRNAAKSPGAKGTAKSNWGVNNTVEFRSFTVRASYTSLKLDVEAAQLETLIGAFSGLSAGLAPFFPASSAQALAMTQKYKLDGIPLSTVSLGLGYDPGDWFMTGEFVNYKGGGFVSSGRSWYANAGYRFGSLTPYVMYSQTKAKSRTEPGVSLTGSPFVDPSIAALNGVLNSALAALAINQKTSTVGLRWDFAQNFALKTQYDRIQPADNENGRLTNLQPGYVPGRKVDLFSVAVDFVF